MLLSALLKDVVSVNSEQDCEVAGLCSDSRKIKPGDLFFAYPGMQVDGRDFIDAAIAGGASAVLCEADNKNDFSDLAVPILFINNLQYHVGFIAAKFYDFPAQKMRMIGITGTNGKTSCSHYLAQALGQLNIPCGIVGTLGVGFPGNLQPGVHTTPDPISLQKHLFDLQQQGAKAIAMEVSSHGLDQNRIDSIQFDIAVFTNLSRDHLDYHRTMENYGAAKKKLFLSENLRNAVINADDDFGVELINAFKDKLLVVGFSMQDTEIDIPIVRATDVKISDSGYHVGIASPWGNGVLSTKLLGRFNVSNLLAVLSVLEIMEIPLPEALNALAKIIPVPGRMQSFGGGKKQPLVVVDYAHTPDALMQALTVLREHCHGHLWCVFGCGGDRDRGKRPLMGELAERLSDQIIITDDNPRTEDSLAIIEEIKQGLLCPWAAEIESDRAIAIAHALDCANAGDIILVAGKGHEDYQVVGNERMPFSDVAEVQRNLGIKNAVK